MRRTYYNRCNQKTITPLLRLGFPQVFRIVQILSI